MKKIFVLFEILGFVVMLGAAGSADNNTISFLHALVMELSGIFVILLSASGHCYYKKYCRKKRRRVSLQNARTLLKKTGVSNQTVKA